MARQTMLPKDKQMAQMFLHIPIDNSGSLVVAPSIPMMFTNL